MTGLESQPGSAAVIRIVALHVVPLVPHAKRVTPGKSCAPANTVFATALALATGRWSSVPSSEASASAFAIAQVR
jgi:hypothetical protein